MSVLLILVAAPAFFAVSVWVVVSALRILRPDEPQPARIERLAVRMRRPMQRAVVVEASGSTWRPARDPWRDFHHADYTYGVSGGVPEAWLDDMLQRRN